MASDINRVVLIGRFTRDPELKTTNSGQSFCRFTLASNHTAKQGDQWQDKPGFFDCILWGNKAEALAKHAVKGQRLLVEGHLRWSSWEHEGKKQRKIEISVEAFNFIERKAQSGEAPPSEPSPAAFDGLDEIF